MIQICQKDKEKGYDAIRTGKIDVAEMSFPNLIDDIILTMKGRGLIDFSRSGSARQTQEQQPYPFWHPAVPCRCSQAQTQDQPHGCPFHSDGGGLLAELGWKPLGQ